MVYLVMFSTEATALNVWLGEAVLYKSTSYLLTLSAGTALLELQE